MKRYCAHCGAPIKEGFAFCGECGNKVEDDLDSKELKFEDVFGSSENEAPEMNEETTTSNFNIDFTQAEKSIKKGINVASNAAKVGLNDANSFLSEQKQKHDARLQQKIDQAQGRVIEHPEGSIEIWSELKRDTKRKHYYDENGCSMEQDDFMKLLADKLYSAQVPAKVMKSNIWWDRSSVSENQYYIQPETTVANPFSCLVMFNKIGKFTFVERKVFITPPDLPKVPGTKLPIKNRSGASFIGIGIVLILVGIIGIMFSSPAQYSDSFQSYMLLFLFLGVVSLAGGIFALSDYNKILEHNKKVDQEQLAWDKAWEDWINTFFRYSYQEDINGHLSRIFDSVYDCINQVSEEFIKGKLLGDETERSDLNDLEELISRRKTEYQ